MKPKEIISKLNIENGVPPREKEKFLKLMLSQVEEAYDKYGVNDSEQHFTAAVKEVYSKWNAISNKIKHPLSEGLWNYFFAMFVIPLKREKCPTWSKIKDIKIKEYNKKHNLKQDER